ncbi:MAG: hypothetical protein ACXW6K_15160 [Candidatus Binatia bacterium]
MKFEARPLRVQLPCKSVTLIDADEYDAQLQAHQYWRAIALEAQAKFGQIQGMCEECSANPSEPLCQNASEDYNLFAFIDARVLPILRKQLEARLQEIEKAEEAVARASGGG